MGRDTPAAARLPRLWVVLVLIVSLLAAACGTRQSHDDVVAAAGGTRGATSSRGPTAAGAVETGGTGTPALQQTSSGSDTTGPDNAGATQVGAPVENGPPGAGDTSPIIIGSVGNYSGPAGAAQKPGMQAVQAWVSYMNDHGGLDGHPIQYIVVDDASDPSRHAAAVKDLVENRGVIAFVGQYASQTHQGARQYIEDHHVPVIGGEVSLDLWYQSPMYFPQSPPFEQQIFGGLQEAHELVPDKNRLGSFTCVEAQVCTDGSNFAHQDAGANGYSIVYEGKGSIAQPDYTAACLNMKSANVQVLVTVFDQASSRRTARDCARQGVKPVYVFSSFEQTDQQVADFGTAIVSSQVFPFAGVDSPGVQEYKDVMARYAPDVALGSVNASGWAAAKLFERAAKAFGTSKPTTEAVLQGLTSLQGETLGGLTVPLTFHAGAPADRPLCGFPMVLQGGQFSAPHGLDPVCR